jgi:hypothetical protein
MSMNPQTESTSGTIFDRQGLIDRVKVRCAPIDILLDETTGDKLDYENLRFFTGTNLNGADESVVSVLLTPDSPSAKAAMKTEEQAPLADLAPLPICVLLPLAPCNCFRSLENGVPYLYRILNYEQAELVNAAGEFVRYSTSFSWTERGAANPEPEWHKYLGNYILHFLSCGTISSNQGSGG